MAEYAGSAMVLKWKTTSGTTLLNTDFRTFVWTPTLVVLGRGKTMFDGIREKLNLKLIKTRIFKIGNVLLTYEPAT